VLSCFQVSNLDIGGHMAVGREILKSRAIPSVDFLSHTNAGHPYPVHQWLGEVALFAVDYLTGVNGLVALRMLVDHRDGLESAVGMLREPGDRRSVVHAPAVHV
jgi:hypothetical protein